MVYLSSLACADLLNLEREAGELIRAGHPGFHIDLMDGHYVPNLCMSLDVVKALKRRFSCEVDVHLMVDDPSAYVAPCAEAGVDSLAFHLDGARYPYRLIGQIHALGMKAGVVLNPKDDPGELGALSEEMDYVLVMSIEPGFAGQAFMEMAYGKIQRLDVMRRARGLGYQISVDGGIDVESGQKCARLGADMLVMGVYSFFNQGMPLYDACNRYVGLMEGR